MAALQQTRKNYYWDSCVLIRWLTETPRDYVEDIDKYLSDNGVLIHMSTVSFTEILRRHFKMKNFGSIQDLMDDLSGVVSLIDPTPDIMIKAGILRDYQFKKIVTDGSTPPETRILGGADSIHLATALHLIHERGVSGLVFHTFDDGRSRSSEAGGKRTTPLLSFHEWTDGIQSELPIQQVVSMGRTMPRHPECPIKEA